jgi:hypothetical protein
LGFNKTKAKVASAATPTIAMVTILGESEAGTLSGCCLFPFSFLSAFAMKQINIEFAGSEGKTKVDGALTR